MCQQKSSRHTCRPNWSGNDRLVCGRNQSGSSLDRRAARRVAAGRCRGSRRSTISWHVTAETLTEQKLPHTSRGVAAGRCRGSWRSQGYPGMCQQKSSRNKGLPHPCRPNWSGIDRLFCRGNQSGSSQNWSGSTEESVLKCQLVSESVRMRLGAAIARLRQV